ncbi:MAG: TonB-dependent receptor, partial [Armatimonadetes bacterium]|nr:TonB-dependent receptor [Akkermansiaceae bacterium]
LDHFELVRSQGSVLYGSDAVGGTLNAFSKHSGFEDEPEGRTFLHGSAYYEYRTNGQGSHLGRLESQTGIGGKFGLHLGISAKEFGDIEDSSVGLMRGTGYPEQSIDARLDYAFTPQTKLTLTHQNFEQDKVSRWHSTLNNPGWIHGSSMAFPGTFIARDIDQERSLTYLRIAHENEQADAPLRRVTATLSYQSSAETELQIRTATDSRRQSYDVDVYGVDLEVESPIARGTLIYGLDHYHDSVESTAARDRGTGFTFDPANRPVADDSSYDLFGAYAQYIRPFDDKFELIAGLRYTHARAELGKFYNPATKLDESAQSSWDDLSASIRATYRPDADWVLFGGVSQAFRAPNLNDLSGNLTARSGDTLQGSLDVEPEKFLTSELGIRKDSNQYAFSAAIFYTHISDIITPVPITAGSATTIATNARDGYVYGIELEGMWRINPLWTLSGFASWQEGNSRTPAFLGGPEISESISRLLPLSGSVALRWQHASVPLWVEGRIQASTKADQLSSADRTDTQRIPVNGTPAYAVASVRAGYDPTANIHLTAAVENIVDDDYRLHGSGQNEPGINTILGLKYSW